CCSGPTARKNPESADGRFLIANLSWQRFARIGRQGSIRVIFPALSPSSEPLRVETSSKHIVCRSQLVNYAKLRQITVVLLRLLGGRGGPRLDARSAGPVSGPRRAGKND